MPEDTIDLETLGKSVLEVLMSEAQAFYDEEGKAMLEADKDLVQELAKDTAKLTYKLALAKAQGDEDKVNLYSRGLNFVTSTLQLRLMLRELQIAGQAQERLERLLRRVVEVLAKALPVLLKGLLQA